MSNPVGFASAVVVVVALALGFAGEAHAQVFSPGPLSKSHTELEGIGNCKRCHGDDTQHDNGRCLECHKEINVRRQRGDGYHGRLGAQVCAECHREHRGVAAAIVEWPAGQRGFSHALTSWPLVGKHKKADCRDCHQQKRIVDDDARELQQKKGRETFLGLPSTCAACHFDEHRSDAHGGKPGNACATCHTPEGFKPAKLFNHNNQAMADFPLTGLHKKVDCAKCHTTITDDTTPGTAFPAPAARTYLQMNDLPHQSCVDCHEDVHRGAFGRNCTQCHSTAGWQQILQSAEDFGFHDKTKFPLRGSHTSVACKSCHGPFAGEKAVFKGLRHGQCADCHIDAHVAQLAVDPKTGVVACERCHTVNGFVPVLYDAVAHQQTAFSLQGAHQAVSCTGCHTVDDKLARRVPQTVRAKLQRQRRQLLVSSARLKLPGLKRLNLPPGDDKASVVNRADSVGDHHADFNADTVRCESCHDDPHAGQFDDRIKQRGCNSCHQTSSFRQERFNHDDSRFPLVGKHKDVACSRCHLTEPATKKTKSKAPVVRYRPMALQCASCHSDEHVGQLRRPADGDTTDCARCHQPTGFKPTTFRHDDPAQTRFVLEGKHKDVACVKCHVAIHVEGVDQDDKTTARYRPVPTDCATCHEDDHDGHFDRFAP